MSSAARWCRLRDEVLGNVARAVEEGAAGASAIASPFKKNSLFVGGYVTDPVAVFLANGQPSTLHFDTSGRVLVSGVVTATHTEVDDNDVAPGHTVDEVLNINYIFDPVGGGTPNWMRQEGGVDNSPGPAFPQVSYIGGIVTDPLDVFVDGDTSGLHFDTSGRVLVSGVTTSTHTEVDDDDVAIGHTVDEVLAINYFVNRDGAPNNWRRWPGYVDDNDIPDGDVQPTVIPLNYLFAGAGGGDSWIRWGGGVENAVVPLEAKQPGFVGGLVTDPLDTFADDDASMLHFDTQGCLLTRNCEDDPFELALSQAAIAGGGTFTSAVVQQNALQAGSRGRTYLHGFVHYAGTASSVTVFVDISLDAGVTFISVGSFTVVSGVVTLLQDYSVSLGNRIRIRVVNNDAVNGTGTTNLAFYLTKN